MMSPRLLLAVAGAALFITIRTVSAQSYYRCSNVTSGELIGSGVEKFHFVLGAGKELFTTSLPHRYSVLVNGIEVIACGIDCALNVATDKYSVRVARAGAGGDDHWLPVDIRVTRRLSTLSDKGEFHLI